MTYAKVNKKKKKERKGLTRGSEEDGGNEDKDRDG